MIDNGWKPQLDNNPLIFWTGDGVPGVSFVHVVAAVIAIQQKLRQLTSQHFGALLGSGNVLVVP